MINIGKKLVKLLEDFIKMSMKKLEDAGQEAVNKVSDAGKKVVGDMKGGWTVLTGRTCTTCTVRVVVYLRTVQRVCTVQRCTRRAT